MLYRAKIDGDINVRQCKKTGNDVPLGYELTNTYFVDNSGFGTDGESALTFNSFLTKVKAGYYYGIRDAGQFQVYIGEFKKTTKTRREIYIEAGIIQSKKVANNMRLTTYNRDLKVITVLRLHQTDIITWHEKTIVLNSGGWDTMTTRARFNEFLAPNGIRVFRKKGKTYINTGKKDIEFFDGIELEKNTIL